MALAGSSPVAAAPPAAPLHSAQEELFRGTSLKAVYVGREKKRFVINTHFLNHYLFKALLKRSEEEFGFSYSGGLVIPCKAVLFKHMLWLFATNHPAVRTTELDDLLEFYEF